MSEPLYPWNTRMLQLLKESRLTNEEWFTSVGFNQANLSKIKKGTRSFTLEQMIKAAKMHHTTLDWICGLTDDRTQKQNPSAIDLLEEGLRRLKEG